MASSRLTSDASADPVSAWRVPKTILHAAFRSSSPLGYDLVYRLRAERYQFFLAGHLANRRLPMPVVFDRYEHFMYQQWLRVYMRSQMIKHNKDLLQLVDDTEGLLAKLHIY